MFTRTGWESRTRPSLVLSVLVLLGASLVGCAQLSNFVPFTDQTSHQIANISGKVAASCNSNWSALTGTDRETAIQEALNDMKVKSLINELDSRGFTINVNAAAAYSINSEKLVYLPAGSTAAIVYETYLGIGHAVGIIQEGNKTVNIQADGAIRHLAGFDPKTRAKYLKQLRFSKQIKSLEKELKNQDQIIDWSHTALIVDIENKRVAIGLALKEANSSKPAWIGYDIEATVKEGKLTIERMQTLTLNCGGVSTNSKRPRGAQVRPADGTENINAGEGGLEPGWVPVPPPFPPVQGVVCVAKVSTTPEGIVEIIYMCIW